MEMKDLLTAIGLVVTASLALTGYALTYRNNVRAANRAERLRIVNDQLKYLYGPLYSLSAASEIAWKKFRSKYRPNVPYFGAGTPPTPQEIEAWLLWMQNVFMPINVKMEEAIISNGHLIEGARMPESFEILLAHVASYRVTMTKWGKDEMDMLTSIVNFPKALKSEVDATYSELKKRQAMLVGAMIG